jgi:hypothetical protein
MKVRAALLLALMLAAGCLSAEDDAPSDQQLADVDQWAAASDGKADLPNTFASVVAWVTDVYRNRMSAIWNNQEHPATATAAVARISALVKSGGVADPTRVLYRANIQRLRTEVLDHSEIDITLPGTAHKVIRLVGDPKGAGAFVDKKLFETSLNPSLCLTWDELTTAVDAAYAPGHYGADFVCHTITERVLRALHVGSSKFTAQIKTYNLARWVWGPVAPSGNPQDPTSWAESRRCN